MALISGAHRDDGNTTSRTALKVRTSKDSTIRCCRLLAVSEQPLSRSFRTGMFMTTLYMQDFVLKWCSDDIWAQNFLPVRIAHGKRNPPRLYDRTMGDGLIHQGRRRQGLFY